ncbi:hypothetical protein [uncultured Actinobacillus sp.]|uniref:hypothetical protein n=1 Tax=uncultured Actinobacillus sp. TaxID=417616 RepID=UPI0025F0ACAE|nr:hypothetical protein [uncultured Actinobacillus sp.]
MAKLINENICLDISVGYNYVDICYTDEFYYYVSIYCNNKPIIYIPEFHSREENTHVIDFELNDSKLSEVFFNALENNCEEQIGLTYEGCFDLSIKPNEGTEDEREKWIVDIQLDSLFFQSRLPKRLEASIKIYCSQEGLLEFAKDLKQEEQDEISAYEEKYRLIER